MISENYVNYPLRMPESLMEWLRQEAAKDRRSVNTLMILLVEQAKEAADHPPTLDFQQPIGQRSTTPQAAPAGQR